LNRWPVLAGLLLAVLIGGGFAVDAIFGQSGEPAAQDEKRVYQPDAPRTPLPDDPCIPPAPDYCPLPSPEPAPSPYVPPHTDVTPIPFKTGLRTDCPEGWESVGQPGVFSICYPPDEWEANPKVNGGADSWKGTTGFGGPAAEFAALRVTFYPRGIPPTTDMCTSPNIRREDDAKPIKIGPHDGVVCVLTELDRVRQYRIEAETSKGLVRARLEVAEPPEGDAQNVLLTALDVLGTLKVEP
jgi:hypothetical protein